MPLPIELAWLHVHQPHIPAKTEKNYLWAQYRKAVLGHDVYTEVVTTHEQQTGETARPSRLGFVRDGEFLLQNANLFSPSMHESYIELALGLQGGRRSCSTGVCATLGVLPTHSCSAGCVLPIAPWPGWPAEPTQEGTAGSKPCCIHTDGESKKVRWSGSQMILAEMWRVGHRRFDSASGIKALLARKAKTPRQCNA